MDVKLFCFLKGLIREIIMTERSEKKKPKRFFKVTASEMKNFLG